MSDWHVKLVRDLAARLVREAQNCRRDMLVVRWRPLAGKCL